MAASGINTRIPETDLDRTEKTLRPGVRPEEQTRADLCGHVLTVRFAEYPGGAVAK